MGRLLALRASRQAGTPRNRSRFGAGFYSELHEQGLTEHRPFLYDVHAR